MNTVTPFVFESHAVRSITDDAGEPWFVGKDVCAALDIKNHNDALTRLPVDERKGVGITDPLGKNPQNTTIINEPGVYRLIMTSRVPAAERFKHWLFHEVLPAIRKTGRYEMPVDDLLIEERRQWSQEISLCLRVHGRSAARKLWNLSPLPKVAAAPSVLAGGDDARECLERLLSWQPTAGSPTFGDALTDAESNGRWLRDHGLMPEPRGFAGTLAVARNHPALRRVFARTKWRDTWAKVLLGLPGTTLAPDPLWFPGGSRRAVLIPAEVIERA